MAVTWGAICRPKQGQSVSGDVFVVCDQAEAGVLVAVIDGLGGGAEAAHAARAAEQIIRARAGWPLKDVVREAHYALHATRGAVVGLLRLDLHEQQARYVGVGNTGVYVQSRQPIKPISKNGILGFRLPALLELRYTFDRGDVFVLHSDGISSLLGQDGQIDFRQPPQHVAERILASYGKLSDDATVVVVKT